MAEKIQTTCNYCALSCGLDVYVENNEIQQILPKENYPVNPDLLCIKGFNLDKQQSIFNPSSPLPKIKQEDGTIKEVSWDEGFTYVADKLTDIKENYGSDAIAGISTGQLLVEDFALLGHVMRNHLKAHLDGNTRLCMATAVVAYKQAFGFDAPGYTLKDIELSDTIVFIGANPVDAHPVLWNRVRRSRKETDRIINIDPRKSRTAQESDYHYAIDHSSDLPLLYTVANLLIERDALDHEFIKNHTNQFEEFKAFVSQFDLDYGVRETGLTAEEILEFTDLIATGEKVSFWWTMGVNQHHEGVRVAQAIINIALMTGNIGRPGTGANSLTGQTNAMGSRAFSNTTALYGGYDYADPTGRERVAEVLKVDESYLADGPTFPYHRIIEEIEAGNIKALWVVCTNPRHSFSNNETFQKAIEKLELFVVQDLYEDTETSGEAGVFFPVVPAIKKSGTIINTERRLSPVRPVITRDENEMTDFDVFKGVGKALGMDLTLWDTPKDVFNLMRENSRNQPCDITGVDWDKLTRSEGVQWPFPEGEKLTTDERRLYEDGQFYTPDGRAKFVYELPQEHPNPKSEEFPIILNNGRNNAAEWHTRSRTREIPATKELFPSEVFAIIGPKMAAELQVDETDQLLIHSSNGESAVVDIEIMEEQRNDEIFIPIHYIECNQLTQSVYDPYSFEPSYKDTPVRVEKAIKEEATV